MWRWRKDAGFVGLSITVDFATFVEIKSHIFEERCWMGKKVIENIVILTPVTQYLE